MPIKSIDLTAAPGFVIQACACCDCEHKVKLDRGAVDTDEGPYNIPVGATLELKVDGQATPQTITFAAGDFPDFTAVTPTQLRDKLNASLAGAAAVLNLDGEDVSIESNTTGPDSRVEVTGGTARDALGFHCDGIASPCSGRPVLGREIASGLKHKDVIAMRRCPCGSQEQLVRTWDVCDPKYAGTHHYEHRRAVNALATYFKSQGWIDPALAAEINAETTNPLDVATGLPTTVITVPPPVPEARTPGGGGGW
jgi:hypothetical protein